MYFPIISEADSQALKYYKKHGIDPIIRLRAATVELRCRRVAPKMIVQLLTIHPNSVTNWVKRYIQYGVKGLLQVNRYRPQSDLMNYRDQIMADFTHNPPASIGQAAKRIFALTGLRRGITQVRYFLKHVLRFKYRKFRRTSGGPRSVSQLQEEQSAFLRDTLFPLLDKARRGVVQVFFVDAVHPVQGFHQGQVWSVKPVVVASSAGRQRANLLGALNAVRPELWSITEPKYVNAQTVCELISFLREEHPGERLHLVMDNARYQRCHKVTECAKRKRVHLVFLPAYSPNLNLIERLWKFMKKNFLAGQYHATKQDFIDAIDRFIEEVNHGIHNEELTSLLNLNFQTLEEPTRNHIT